MIKAKVLKDSTLTALCGSVVLVSECQFKALGDNVVIVPDEEPTTDNEAAKSEEPKPTTKRTTKKK